MARSTFVRILTVLLVFAFLGVMVAVAAEGTVVSIEKGKLTVSIGGKNEEISTKGVKLLDKDGTQLKGKKAGEVLKAGVKVEITKEGDKVVEVKVK
jgi:hypothetical protein